MCVQARVPNVDTILVDVGLKHFVEFTLDEAIKFCEFKTKVLAKQADVVRDESIKARAHIKWALLCLGGEQTDGRMVMMHFIWLLSLLIKHNESFVYIYLYF